MWLLQLLRRDQKYGKPYTSPTLRPNDHIQEARGEKPRDFRANTNVAVVERMSSNYVTCEKPF